MAPHAVAFSLNFSLKNICANIQSVLIFLRYFLLIFLETSKPTNSGRLYGKREIRPTSDFPVVIDEINQRRYFGKRASVFSKRFGQMRNMSMHSNWIISWSEQLRVQQSLQNLRIFKFESSFLRDTVFWPLQCTCST